MQAPRQSDIPRNAEEVRAYDRQVWDLVQHLVHPVALYVILEIVIWSRYADHPAVDGWGLVVFGGQFLGAWAVFYGTLLRDMDFRSYAPLALVVVALGGCVAMAFLPHPANTTEATVRLFLGAQLVPALMAWAITFRRWRMLKAQHAPDGGIV